MIKLQKIFEELILESDTQKIVDAINGKYRVKIEYAGDDDSPAGSRTIEVYSYGISLGGNPQIRAYQIWGVSKKGAPNWKTFRVDRIQKWESTGFKFYSPIEQRDSTAPAFNPNSDRLMKTIYNMIKF